jgi:hypothetical protein
MQSPKDFGCFQFSNQEDGLQSYNDSSEHARDDAALAR